MNYARFACLVVLLWPTIAIADTRSVDVQGVGVITVDPNVAFLEGQLYGSGETAADAQEDLSLSIHSRTITEWSVPPPT